MFKPRFSLALLLTMVTHIAMTLAMGQLMADSSHRPMRLISYATYYVCLYFGVAIGRDLKTRGFLGGAIGGAVAGFATTLLYFTLFPDTFEIAEWISYVLGVFMLQGAIIGFVGALLVWMDTFVCDFALRKYGGFSLSRRTMQLFIANVIFVYNAAIMMYVIVSYQILTYGLPEF